MHDCRTTEGWLVDLVFDELGADERRRLLAELDACADCLDEYRSMAVALSAFDEAGEAALPYEAYWPAHHAALRRRLRSVAATVAPRRAPFWRRAFAARLTVPAPAAAAIALALLVSAALALRPRTLPAPSPAPPQQTAAETTPPQVRPDPVVTERVVTRVVYVERRRRERREGRRFAPPAGQNESTLASGREKESGEGGLFTRANLTDFQPANELKIRVIKRSNSDEN